MRILQLSDRVAVLAVEADDELGASLKSTCADDLGDNAAGAIHGADLWILKAQIERINSTVNIYVQRCIAREVDGVSAALLGGIEV